MIKIGDRVTLWDNITREGVVVSLREASNKTWFVGGVSSKTLLAQVQFENEDETVEFPVAKLKNYLDQLI